MEMRLVYLTCESTEQAHDIGKALVEGKLAACVNYWGGMKSLYWWEGKVESANEVVLIAKTRADKIELLIEAVKKLHSYSCPCVLSLPIDGGNPDYLKWLNSSLE